MWTIAIHDCSQFVLFHDDLTNFWIIHLLQIDVVAGLNLTQASLLLWSSSVSSKSTRTSVPLKQNASWVIFWLLVIGVDAYSPLVPSQHEHLTFDVFPDVHSLYLKMCNPFIVFNTDLELLAATGLYILHVILFEKWRKIDLQTLDRQMLLLVWI